MALSHLSHKCEHLRGAYIFVSIQHCTGETLQVVETVTLSAVMGLVRITSWYQNFNVSRFGLPPSEIHRMTGLPPQIAWTMTYSHRPHLMNKHLATTIDQAKFHQDWGLDLCESRRHADSPIGVPWMSISTSFVVSRVAWQPAPKVHQWTIYFCRCWLGWVD